MVMVLGEPIKRWKCTYDVCKAACCRMERELMLRDIKEIIKATGKAPEDFVSISVSERSVVPFLLRHRSGGCVFLEEDHRCALHRIGAKPILCQMYPFLLSKVIPGDEPMMVIRPAAGCPGYGKGPAFNKKSMDEIKAYGRIYVNELRKILRYRSQGVGPEEILRRELQT